MDTLSFTKCRRSISDFVVAFAQKSAARGQMGIFATLFGLFKSILRNNFLRESGLKYIKEKN